MMSDIDELEFNFSDISMCESGGYFDKLNDIMNEEIQGHKWTVLTNLSISSSVGICDLELQCNYEKNIYILSYRPSIGDVYYNPDIPGLSQWAQSHGWNIPEPTQFIVQSDKEFWRFFYDTLIVNCEYFDKVYGKREHDV